MPSVAVKLTPEQAPAQKPVLRVENLQTYFDVRRMGFLKDADVRALDGVSIELSPGDPISIVGERGGGKSTLAKTILGIHQPTKGKLYFDGQDLSQLDKEGWKQYRSNIGYVMQDPYGALPPLMNVKRILEEPLKINGSKDNKEQARRGKQVLEEV